MSKDCFYSWVFCSYVCRIVTIGFIGLISGCVSVVPVIGEPTSKFIDYAKVKPENHEMLAVRYAKNVLSNTLMNPLDMRLDTSETGGMLKLGICQGDQVYSQNRYKIWATTVLVDATNIYGEYTGKKPYTLFFKDGEVIASEQVDARNFDQKPEVDGIYFPCNDVK